MRVKIVEKDVLNPQADKEILRVEEVSIPEKIGRISLLDNTKPQADVILETIRKNLDHINFYDVEKPAGAPATSKRIKKAAEADLSILAVGDCGSCTTWIILDAIRLEQEGTPTISICSDRFTSFARELAVSHGKDNLRIVEIEHPLAGQSKAAVENKTLQILPEIRTLLQ